MQINARVRHEAGNTCMQLAYSSASRKHQPVSRSAFCLGQHEARSAENRGIWAIQIVQFSPISKGGDEVIRAMMGSWIRREASRGSSKVQTPQHCEVFKMTARRHFVLEKGRGERISSATESGAQ